MLAMMGAIALLLVIIGPAALTGHPMLIAVSAALGAMVLFVTRRGRSAQAARDRSSS